MAISRTFIFAAVAVCVLVMLIGSSDAVSPKSHLEHAMRLKSTDKKRAHQKQIIEQIKKKWAAFTSAIGRGVKALKDKFSGGGAGGCATADEIYNMVCPNEQAIVAAYAPYFDIPRGAKLNDAGAKQALDQWWVAQRATFGASQKTNIDALIDAQGTLSGPEKTALKTHTAAFQVMEGLDEATLVGYGFVQVAYAEANAANGMAKPKYLEFGLTHEAGHMLDPANFPQPPAGDGATAVKMFPNRAAITAFNNNWHREIFADYVAAEATKGWTKPQMLEALSVFCGGGADASYPPMRDRILLIARGPYWSKLCPTGGDRGVVGTNYFAFP